MKMKCVIPLCLGLLVFGANTVKADSVLVPCSPGAVCSDALSFTWDGVTQTRFIVEHPGESVTESIDFTFLTGTSDFDSSNFTSDFVYLIEPDQPFVTNPDGTVTGFRSDDVRLSISHETGSLTTTVTVTIRSDEDPGTHDTVTGLLETGLYQDITSRLFGTSLSGSGHTALVKVASDVEAPSVPVPEPASLSLLGAGLLGLAGALRKRRKAR